MNWEEKVFFIFQVLHAYFAISANSPFLGPVNISVRYLVAMQQFLCRWEENKSFLRAKILQCRVYAWFVGHRRFILHPFLLTFGFLVMYVDIGSRRWFCRYRWEEEFRKMRKKVFCQYIGFFKLKSYVSLISGTWVEQIRQHSKAPNTEISFLFLIFGCPSR